MSDSIFILLHDSGKYEECIEECLEVLSKGKKNVNKYVYANAITYAGLASMELKNYRNAICCFDVLILISGEDLDLKTTDSTMEVFSKKFDCYLQLKEIEEAIKTQQEYIKRNKFVLNVEVPREKQNGGDFWTQLKKEAIERIWSARKSIANLQDQRQSNRRKGKKK